MLQGRWRVVEKEAAKAVEDNAAASKDRQEREREEMRDTLE